MLGVEGMLYFYRVFLRKTIKQPFHLCVTVIAHVIMLYSFTDNIFYTYEMIAYIKVNTNYKVV